MREKGQSHFDWVREIQGSDRDEIDKLKEYFERITDKILEHAGNEIELAKAMQDRESVVKHQIKMETIKTARGIFARGYQVATGRKAWDEQDDG